MTPLCDALLDDPPQIEAIEAALAAHPDPNALCRWTGRVPMIDTFGGFLTAVLLPVVSWPVVFTEDVRKELRALPLELAIDRAGDEGARLLLAAGARPYEGALDGAVAADRWTLARMLVDGGATPAVHGIGAPLAGDVERLGKLRGLGIRLDAVQSVEGGGRLLVDPVVASVFLDAGLPARVLLPKVVAAGSPEVLDVCLARVNASDPELVGALRSAATSGRWEHVERLRAAGVAWEAAGQEPVLVAVARTGSLRGVDRVLTEGADPAAMDPLGHTALHMAADDGRADLAVRLLDAGVPIDAVDTWGHSALGLAAADGRTDLVRLLLDRGASPNAGAPLAEALENGHDGVAAVLIGAGATVSDAVLRRLVSSGDADALRYLLRHGLSPDARLADGTSLAVLAVGARDRALLRALVDAGAPLDGDRPVDSALWAAIASGDPKAVDRVLALGADPARLPVDGVWDRADRAMEAVLLVRFHLRPPGARLVDAAGDADVERVALLLAHGADPNGTDAFDRRAIEVTDDRDVEQALLAAGAVVTDALVERLVDGDNWARLERLGVRGAALDPHLVGRIADGDAEGVGWLLAHGVDPNALGPGGERPLVEAVGDDALFAVLVDAGARIALPDSRGRTVLHAAVQRSAESIGRLVAAGAPLEARDEDGNTPMALALAKGWDFAIDPLLDAGHPYDAELVRADTGRCAVSRLHYRRWTAAVEWRELRPIARQAGCRAAVRDVLRERSAGPRSAPRSRER